MVFLSRERHAYRSVIEKFSGVANSTSIIVQPMMSAAVGVSHQQCLPGHREISQANG
jgi:hypothetical protein